MFPDNPIDIISLLSEITPYLAKKRKEHSDEVRLSQKKKQKNEANERSEQNSASIEEKSVLVSDEENYVILDDSDD